MITALLVFVLIAALTVLLPVLAVLALAAFAFYMLRRPFRERRRQAEMRRRLELAELTRARRTEARAIGRAARRDAIRRRTGLDVELLAEVVRDAGRGARTTAGERIRFAGERITRALESRRAGTAGNAGPSAQDGGDAVTDHWLDLDADVGAIRSSVRTAEMLRLTDELWGARAS